MEDIQKYLLKIGFDVNDLPELFNNDDKSYYTIPDLIQGYAEHKKSTAPKFEPQGKYQYAIELLQEQLRLLQNDIKSMLLTEEEFKQTVIKRSDVVKALNKLMVKPTKPISELTKEDAIQIAKAALIEYNLPVSIIVKCDSFYRISIHHIREIDWEIHIGFDKFWLRAHDHYCHSIDINPAKATDKARELEYEV